VVVDEYVMKSELPERLVPIIRSSNERTAAHRVRTNDARLVRQRSNLLKKEFRAQLHKARRIGADDLAEGGTANIAVDGLGPEELSVIENVETLDAKLE
jgi:hypothetical protein